MQYFNHLLVVANHLIEEKYEKYQTDKKTKRFTLLYTMTSKNYKEVFQKYKYSLQGANPSLKSLLIADNGMSCGNTFSSILYSSQVLSICYLRCKKVSTEENCMA